MMSAHNITIIPMARLILRASFYIALNFGLQLNTRSAAIGADDPPAFIII